MSIQLYCNDLSFKLEEEDYSSAKELIAEFCRNLLQAITAGAKNSLASTPSLICKEIVNKYSLQNWLNDKSVDLELRRALKIQLTKSPFISDEVPNDIEVSLDKCDSGILAHCFLEGGLLISLRSKEIFEKSEIVCNLVSVNPETGNIEEGSVELGNISTPAHIEYHRHKIESKLLNNITNGAELLEAGKEKLTNLEFCDGARELIEAIQSSMHLEQLKEQLLELDRYCARWRRLGGGFDINQLSFKVTPESKQCKTNDRSRNARTFLCPDGEERYFEMHSRLTPGNWRVHFYPEHTVRKVLIGYVGPKLYSMQYG